MNKIKTSISLFILVVLCSIQAFTLELHKTMDLQSLYKTTQCAFIQDEKSSKIVGIILFADDESCNDIVLNIEDFESLITSLNKTKKQSDIKYQINEYCLVGTLHMPKDGKNYFIHFDKCTKDTIPLFFKNHRNMMRQLLWHYLQIITWNQSI